MRMLKNKLFEVIFSINKAKKWICFGLLPHFGKFFKKHLILILVSNGASNTLAFKVLKPSGYYVIFQSK